MSLLPCDRDPVEAHVVVDGFWDLDALREHLKACELCECVHDALAAMTARRAVRPAAGPRSVEATATPIELSLAGLAKHKALRRSR